MMAFWLVSLSAAAGMGQSFAVDMQSVEASVQLPEVKALTDSHHCTHSCSLCLSAFFSCGDGGCSGPAIIAAAEIATGFIASGKIPEFYATSFQNSTFPPPGRPPRILA